MMSSGRIRVRCLIATLGTVMLSWLPAHELVAFGDKKGNAPEPGACVAEFNSPAQGQTDAGESDEERVVKTDAEWRAQLTREQFRVTRRKGTEKAFRNAYWKTKTDGIYRCVCCGRDLFDAKTKFDSKTGWPSFWDPIDDKAVAHREDRGDGMIRTEVICRRCDAHLGHVFNDGPRPTGLRYCMNSASLKLVDREGNDVEKKKEKEAKSEPRGGKKGTAGSS
ncbi:MAG: peptide-methionine (R)-S-oxide reductase MsrB [Planctomycetales bacterium]